MWHSKKVFGYIKVERYRVHQDIELFIEIFNPDEQWEGTNSITTLYEVVKDYFKSKPLEQSYEVQALTFILQYKERDNLLHVYVDTVSDMNEMNHFITTLYYERKMKLEQVTADILNTKVIA